MKKIIIIFSIVIVLAAILGASIFLINREDTRVYEDPLDLLYDIEYDGEADYDGDKLTNDEEKENKTDMWLADTDKDGLGDYYEINISNTNPLKPDSDGDTLSDYIEMAAGLDPLNPKTDGTPDEKRAFEEEARFQDVKVKIDGDAKIYGTYIDNFTVTGLDKTPGVMSKTYEIYNNTGKINGEVVFTYNDSYIANKGGDEKNLAIYTFEDDGTFKRVSDSVIDTDSNTVTAKIKNSSKYLLGDSDLIKKEHETKIMLLIDNSGSMFPEELCEGSEENDVEFKRLDMAKSIIENINENVEYGLARFTGDYFHMADLGSDNKKLFEEIESIRDIEENFNGTYIATSIIKSLENFTEEHSNDRKFIVILTDGASTEHAGLLGIFSGNPDEHEAIAECNKKNVAVITIGLGNNVDTEYLKAISNQTGGAYIYANNADALEDIYNSIMSQLVYSGEDIDADGETDSYIIADSGFRMDKNAASFKNFVTIAPGGIRTGGFCFGIAAFAQEFYMGKPNYEGESFEGKQGLINAKEHKIPSFDVSDALKDINNFREYNNAILTKFTNIYAVPSKDRYYIDGDTLKLNKKLKEENSDKYIKFEIITDNITWQDKKLKKYEAPYVDIEKYVKEGEKNDDMEMVVAMYWHWALQLEIQEGIKIVPHRFGSDATESEFNNIVEKISDGVPLIVSYSTSEGGHAITAMRMLRDTDNPTTYYLECYDNNDINNPVIFKIEQSDIGFWDKTSFSNWGENYSLRSYIKNGDKWEKIGLEFEEITR